MELFYYRVLFMLSVIIALNTVNGQNRLAYRIPQPTAAVLTPRGFRISIPGMKQEPNNHYPIQNTNTYKHTHTQQSQPASQPVRTAYKLLDKQTKTIFKHSNICAAFDVLHDISQNSFFLRIHIFAWFSPAKTQRHSHIYVANEQEKD